MDQIKADRWAGIYCLACGAGIRKREILGPPMTALDMEQGFLKVTQSRRYVTSQGLLVLEPKTDKSRRMIVLSGFVGRK